MVDQRRPFKSARRTCAVCGKTHSEEGELCSIHKAASESLNANYEHWLKVFSENLMWKPYLQRVAHLRYTGDAAKAVAKYLLQKES